ncbi:hypothetical protein D3C78_1963140 [compost metagenome]
MCSATASSARGMTSMGILILTRVWAAALAVAATSAGLAIFSICSSAAADAVIRTHRSAAVICSTP